MTPPDLLKTIYYGDRGCKSVLVDGWNRRVAVQVTQISRVRSSSGNWDYYTAEDIPDGLLVFTSVNSVRLEPSGAVPNDFINDIRVTEVSDIRSGKKLFLFVISVASTDDAGLSTEVMIEIQAEDFHVEDPRQPGVEIRS
jgi:hypothetical protein